MTPMARAAQLALIEATSTEWVTPQPLFEELHAEFGFTLDVCASDDNAKCERYYTIAEDGLRQSWAGVCWMNPPYGREIERWVKKAAFEARYGAVVVGLLPVRTDTAWWHDHIIGVGAEVRFIRGRLKFRPRRPGGGNSAPFPSAIVVWRGTTP